MAEENTKLLNIQTKLLQTATEKLDQLNQLTGGRNEEQQKQFDEEKKARSEANQEARGAARQRVKDVINNNKLFKTTAAGFKGLTNSFSKFGGMLGKGFGALVDKGKDIAGDAFGILKKFALVAGLGAVLAFLNSKAWTQTKEIILNKIVPALTNLYNNTLKPIFDIVAVGLVDSFNNFKDLFTGIKDGVTQLLDGDLSGIGTILESIGTAFTNAMDTGLTTIYNVIASIFGLEQTDSVFGSISSFFSNILANTKIFINTTINNIKKTISDTFNGIKDFFFGAFSWTADQAMIGYEGLKTFVSDSFNAVKDFFTNAFSFVSEGIAGTFTNIVDFIKGTFTSVTTFLSDLFSWPDSPEGFAVKLIDIILLPYNLAIKFLEDIFGFGEDDEKQMEGFSIGQFVVDAFNKVKDYFGGLIPDVLDAGLDVLDFLTTFASDLFNSVSSAVSDLLPSIDDIKALLPDFEFNLPNLGDMFMNLIGRILPSPNSFFGKGLYKLPGTEVLKEAAEAFHGGGKVIDGKMTMPGSASETVDAELTNPDTTNTQTIEESGDTNSNQTTNNIAVSSNAPVQNVSNSQTNITPIVDNNQLIQKAFSSV